MRQATTPTVRIRTNYDFSGCTEIRVALTKRGAKTPYCVKKLSAGQVEVHDTTDVWFTLTQQETIDLEGAVDLDMRVKDSGGSVIGFRRGGFRSRESHDIEVMA